VSAKILFTTPLVPHTHRITVIYPMVVGTYRVPFGDSERAELARKEFAELGGDEANAIVAVGINTTVVAGDDGVMLYMTFFGTPALVEGIQDI